LKGGDTVYAVVYLRNGVGSFATVMKTDTLQAKLRKYFSAGWKVYVASMRINSYAAAKALAATL
jgi:hypothetical protein